MANVIYFCNPDIGKCEQFAEVKAPIGVVNRIVALLNEESKGSAEYDACPEEVWKDINFSLN